MNREQETVFSLLREVDEICRKHEITYYLSPQLALCGVTGQPFPKNPMAGKIWMKIADMEKFRQVVEAEPLQDRALESMRNNKNFPGFYLHYVNLKTLCYRLNYGDDFLYPGFCIQIYPLRARHSNWKKQRMTLFLEKGWCETCYEQKKTGNLKLFLSGCMVRVLSLSGKARFGKKLYDRLCRKLQVEETSAYTLTKNRNRMFFPAEIFEESGEVLLEGSSFMVPGNVDAYLKKMYGSSYETKEAESYTPSANVMLSTLVGYEEYLREAGSRKALVRARRRVYLIDAPARRISSHWKWCWKYVGMCASARKVDQTYRRKTHCLKNLMKCGNYARLEQEFKTYTEKIKQFLKLDMLGVEDGEVLELYLEYLEKVGQTGLKEQIERCRK